MASEEHFLSLSNTLELKYIFFGMGAELLFFFWYCENDIYMRHKIHSFFCVC